MSAVYSHKHEGGTNVPFGLMLNHYSSNLAGTEEYTIGSLAVNLIKGKGEMNFIPEKI